MFGPSVLCELVPSGWIVVVMVVVLTVVGNIVQILFYVDVVVVGVVVVVDVVDVVVGFRYREREQTADIHS